MRTSECVLNLRPLRQRFRKLWRTKRLYCAPHVPTEVTRLTIRLLEGVEPSRHNYIAHFLTKRKSSAFLLSGPHFVHDVVFACVLNILKPKSFALSPKDRQGFVLCGSAVHDQRFADCRGAFVPGEMY